MRALPEPIASLAEVLATMRGTVAVVLGGSRALGTASAASDWDLGVCYRGAIDTTALARFGVVYPPQSWGRVMNGGAWLTIDGTKVDVLLRDLDVVEDWSARARGGEFEVDATNASGCSMRSASSRARVSPMRTPSLPRLRGQRRGC
jgi:hypothetical protein